MAARLASSGDNSAKREASAARPSSVAPRPPGRNVATPPSMDGRSLAPWLVQKEDEEAAEPAASFGRKEVLVEYIGLTNVVRYEHLEDTWNNTFRALRVIDPAAPAGQRNLMLAEFTDCRTNWDFEQPFAEAELFDLDADPHQLRGRSGAARQPQLF